VGGRLEYLCFILLGCLYWALLPSIYLLYPFPHNSIPFEQLGDDQLLKAKNSSVETLGSPTDWIYPVQKEFPQTCYTLYPSEFWMKEYGVPKIIGFYVNDDTVHGMNLLVKYLMFITVCYPFMLKVKRVE